MTTPDSEAHDARHGEILDELIAALHDGAPLPGDEELRARFPDLAEDLIPKVAALRRMELRPAAPEAQPPLDGSLPQGAPEGYRNLRLLGKGGMGVVYLCEEEALKRTVCLKILPAWFLPSPEAIARFQREAEIIARVNHPGIVKIHSRGMWGDVPYFTMEYITGESLDAVLAARAADPGCNAADPAYIRRCLRDIRDVCGAIQVAHAHDVIHRDLKPSNIIYDGESLRVLDFGMALDRSANAITHSLRLMGSLPYMSPEQLAPKALDPRTDIYSLGVTLYEMLALTAPFADTSSHRLRERILLDPPPRLRTRNKGVGRDVEAIVEKAMEKDPARRYASASAMAEDISRALADMPVLARRIGPATRTLRWLRRRRHAVAAGIVVAAALYSLGLGAQLAVSRYGHGRELVLRTANAVAQARAVLDGHGTPSLRTETVDELIRLAWAADGNLRRDVLAALAQIAQREYRFKEALQLLGHAGAFDPTQRAWTEVFHHFDLLLRASREAPDREADAFELLRRAAAAHPQARVLLDARARTWGPAPTFLSTSTCTSAAVWNPGDGARVLAAAKAGGSKAALLVADARADALRAERPQFSELAIEAEEIHYLLSADLDEDGHEELWVIGTRTKNGAREAAIWRIVPGAGKYEPGELFAFGTAPSFYRNAACAARLPLPPDGRPRPGLLLGIYDKERDLSFFTFHGEGMPLRRHYLYCPPRRGARSSSADVDSLALLPPANAEEAPRIVVNYGNWDTLRTVVLAFDKGLAQYIPAWEQPMGGVRQCCAVTLPGRPHADALFLGNGGEVFHSRVFGRKNPAGPRKGFYLLDLADPMPHVELLDAHPRTVTFAPVFAARGRLALQAHACDVVLAINNPMSLPAGIPAQLNTEVRLFVFDGPEPNWMLLPARIRPLGGVFAQLDDDPSDELVLYGDGGIELYGLKRGDE